MRALNWVVGGAILLTAYAAHADIISVNPTGYAPGQVVTDPTGGSTFTALNEVTLQNPAPGESPYLMQPSPVYASGDTFGVFGDIFTSDSLTEFGGPVSAPLLEVSFTAPTDFVSAAIGVTTDKEDTGAIEAFDGQGQMVGWCEGDLAPGSMSCDNGTGAAYTLPGVQDGFAMLSLSMTSDDISTVLIGAEGVGNSWQVGLVQYDSAPEPGTLAIFGVGLLALAWSRRPRIGGTRSARRGTGSSVI